MRGEEDRGPFEPSGPPRLLKICLGAAGVGIIASMVIFFLLDEPNGGLPKIEESATQSNEPDKSHRGRDNTEGDDRER